MGRLSFRARLPRGRIVGRASGRGNVIRRGPDVRLTSQHSTPRWDHGGRAGARSRRSTSAELDTLEHDAAIPSCGTTQALARKRVPQRGFPTPRASLRGAWKGPTPTTPTDLRCSPNWRGRGERRTTQGQRPTWNSRRSADIEAMEVLNVLSVRRRRESGHQYRWGRPAVVDAADSGPKWDADVHPVGRSNTNIPSRVRTTVFIRKRPGIQRGPTFAVHAPTRTAPLSRSSGNRHPPAGGNYQVVDTQEPPGRRQSPKSRLLAVVETEDSHRRFHEAIAGRPCIAQWGSGGSVV